MNIKTKRAMPVSGFGPYIPLLTKLNAIVFLVLSITCWAKTLGISGSKLQFDHLSDEGKALAAFLCVLRPLVALGMWGRYRWGWAVWIIAVLCDCIKSLGFGAEFGTNTSVLLYHFIFIAVISMYSLHEFYTQKRLKPDD